MPKVVKRINNTFTRADQIQWSEGKDDIDYFAPIVADAEAGFGGVLNAFELMKSMIEAGAAGVHFEDQLASVKKCGHMGGKVLVPTREAIAKLTAARLAADVMGVPTVLLARTDAEAADLVTSDVDDNDKPFLTGERTVEGFYRTRHGLDQAVSPRPRLRAVRRHGLVRDRQARPRLTRRRSPRRSTRSSRASCWRTTARRSFNWKKNLDDATIAKFQRELGAMGYKFQFITLAGFHSLNYSMFNLAHGYARNSMSAFVELQEAEFAAAEKGFTAVKHQREVGTGYFDAVTTTIERDASTARAQGLDRGRAVLRPQARLTPSRPAPAGPGPALASPDRPRRAIFFEAPRAGWNSTDSPPCPGVASARRRPPHRSRPIPPARKNDRSFRPIVPSAHRRAACARRPPAAAAFGFDDVGARASSLAARPYKAPAVNLPDAAARTRLRRLPRHPLPARKGALAQPRSCRSS